jgi:hypothetical protein
MVGPTDRGGRAMAIKEQKLEISGDTIAPYRVKLPVTFVPE